MLTVCMIALLCSCNTNGKSTANEDDGNTNDAALQGDATDKSWEDVKNEISADKKGKTLKVYSWNELNAVTGAVDVVDKFTKETGIKVEWITGSFDTYASELSAMVSADNAPDVIRLNRINVSLLTLMQPLSAAKYNFNDAVWDKDVMKYYTVKGKSFGVAMKNTLLQQPCVLYYNKSLASQFGMDDPYTIFKKNKWTWDYFIEYCEDFKDKAGDAYNAWSPHDGEDCMNKRGISYISFDGTQFKSNMNDTKVSEAFKEYSEIFQSGITTGSFWNQAGFNAGKTLFFTDSIIGARKTHFYYTDLKATGNLGVVPIPEDENLEKNYQQISEYEAYGIPKNAKNADLVPYFLRYYLDADNYDEKNFFNDATMLDVYKYCMGKENKFVDAESGNVLTEAFGLKRDDLSKKLIATQKAQVDSTLKTYAAQVENAVKQANNKLKQVG